MKLNKINLSGVSYDLQDYEASQALSGKQDTLVSGTNIKTVNNESLLGEGNIEIQGGGATYSAGTNISIDTANTINCTLPISKTGNDSVLIGKGNYMSIGSNVQSSVIAGNSVTAATGSHYSLAVGNNLHISNPQETSTGYWNKTSNSSSIFGNSGNTLVSFGNGKNQNLMHNAFEVRQNGDIYFPDTDNTTYANYYQKPMVRLQDMYGELGNKLEASAITTSVTSASTDSQVPSAKAVYDALQESGGGTVDTELDSTSENPVQNKVIYQKFDEVEEVTAAALNALNDKIGDINTLLEGI